MRVVVDGKRTTVGFTCGLAEARRRAPEIRQALLEGKDLSDAPRPVSGLLWPFAP